MTISSTLHRVYKVYKGVPTKQKHFKTAEGPAKDVYGYCWTIGVKWRDMIGPILEMGRFDWSDFFTVGAVTVFTHLPSRGSLSSSFRRNGNGRT